MFFNSHHDENTALAKKNAAEKAISLLGDHPIVGVGTGSTVKYFIDALAEKKSQIEGAVSSSEATTALLKEKGIPVIDANSISEIPIYFDGADAVDKLFHMIKGGGGAMTREKILATMSQKFVCMIDESKEKALSSVPLPIEVIPLARSHVARELLQMGGAPAWRQDFITDNGNIILDIYHLDMSRPLELERTLNEITGVVCHGLFARRAADTLVIGNPNGAIIKEAQN